MNYNNDYNNSNGNNTGPNLNGNNYNSSYGHSSQSEPNDDRYQRYFPDDFQKPPKKKSPIGKIALSLALVLGVSVTSSMFTAYLMSDNNKMSSSSIVQNTINATEMSSDSSYGELSVPEIAEKVNPSVVGIESTSYEGTGVGTGIILTNDGYIVTNNHVIEGGTKITVTLHNQNVYEATVIGTDAKTDLAVLKIESTEAITPAEFGNSDDLEVGELAIAIGNPGGLELQGTLTGGYISAINRDIVVEDRTMTLIQTDAAINPGNSGGPLINKYGQVIGINTIKISASDVEGLGFAIPINDALEIVDELITNGYVTGRPAIGISGTEINEFTASINNVPQGVYVSTVDTRADAYEKGLKSGDIITGINGVEVKTMTDINDVKEGMEAGETITITVYRDGNYYDVDIMLMDEQELQTEIVPEYFIPSK